MPHDSSTLFQRPTINNVGPPPDRSARRLRSLAIGLGAFVVLVVSLSLVMAAQGRLLVQPSMLIADHPPIEASASISLSDDDNGSGLFSDAHPLSPNAPRSACIAVSSSRADATANVNLAAVDVTGELASDLGVTIEMGSGGSLNDCSKFTGSTIWSGTLAELAALSPSGIDLGWNLGDHTKRSFRFETVISSTSAISGLTTQAVFQWRTVSATPTPTPSDPTSTATTSPPATSSPTTTTPPTASPTTAPTSTLASTIPSTTPSSTATTTATQGSAATPTDITLTPHRPGLAAVAQRAVQAAGKAVVTATAAVLHGAMVAATALADEPRPVGLTLLIGLVALVSHSLSARRDPRFIAAARMRNDDLHFPDAYRIQRRRPGTS